jgi:hypothetical protein
LGITFTQKGSFKNIEAYLKRLNNAKHMAILDKYGAMGVAALSNATPVETGETANAWYYKIVRRKGYYSIRWYNSHIEDGMPIAVLLQYGHGTGTGGYVQGRDYINPAIRPIFDQMINDFWREVT